MILFCDTSALIKLYIKEAFSEEIRQQTVAAKGIAVARIAWVEAMSALARRVRENPLDADAIETVRARLRNDWAGFAIVAHACDTLPTRRIRKSAERYDQ